MSQGTGGVPMLSQQTGMGPMNIFDNMKQNQAAISLAQTPENIFSLIQKAYSGPSMSSVLPYVQAQFDEQGMAMAPQYEAVLRGGEEMAAQAQSDAGTRGLRGSDIEAAGVAGARQAAQQNVATLRSQLAVAQAQTMAQDIMEAYGFDIKQNSQMYSELAKAIGEQLAQKQELELAKEQIKAQEKAQKEKNKNSILVALIESLGMVGGGFAAGLAKKGG